MILYLQLFYEYFKAGLFAVGGGLATLPFLYAISDATGWFTYQQLADMIAISESTPGPIGVNMATYVGFTTGGVPGVLAATLGLITPSVIVIFIVAGFLKKFQNSRGVQYVFYGLRPASVAMIASSFVAIVTMALLRVDTFRASQALADLFNWKAILLAAALWISIKKWKKLHPAIFLLLSAIVGILFEF